MSLRRKYEKFHNIKLKENEEIHHKIPRHLGGTDDIENLIHLSKFEHATAHLDLYKKYGNFRDLCAYYMIGYNFTEAHKISSSTGGKIAGKKVFEKKIGIFRNDEDRKVWASMGGKIGGKIQAELGLGFHQYKTNPELHKQWASKGGKTSGNFQNKEFQSEMGKRGGIKNAGSVWINDGKTSLKYTTKQQQNKSIEDFLLENKNIKKGRLKNNENQINKKTG